MAHPSWGGGRSATSTRCRTERASRRDDAGEPPRYSGWSPSPRRRSCAPIRPRPAAPSSSAATTAPSTHSTRRPAARAGTSRPTPRCARRSASTADARGRGEPRVRAFFADRAANAYAVDAESGRAALATAPWTPILAAAITGSVSAHQGRVFVPVSSNEDVGPMDPDLPLLHARPAPSSPWMRAAARSSGARRPSARRRASPAAPPWAPPSGDPRAPASGTHPPSPRSTASSTWARATTTADPPPP